MANNIGFIFDQGKIETSNKITKNNFAISIFVLMLNIFYFILF